MGTPGDSYHHDDLREALLQTATRIIDEKGVNGLTMRELSRQTGVSRTAPYRHFEDKSDLLATVATQGFDQLRKQLRQARLNENERPDPMDRFRQMGLAYVEFARDYPTHYRLMFGRIHWRDGSYPELEAIAEETYGELVNMIETCQAAGKLEASEPEQMAFVAWSLVHGLASLIIDGHAQGISKLDELIRYALEWLTGGMKPSN